jgi:hypothetical protein
VWSVQSHTSWCVDVVVVDDDDDVVVVVVTDIAVVVVVIVSVFDFVVVCSMAAHDGHRSCSLAGEKGVTHLFVSAAPCGHCRQFIAELDGGADVIVDYWDVTQPLRALLPNAFYPIGLGNTTPLLSHPRQTYSLPPGALDGMLH